MDLETTSLNNCKNNLNINLTILWRLIQGCYLNQRMVVNRKMCSRKVASLLIGFTQKGEKSRISRNKNSRPQEESRVKHPVLNQNIQDSYKNTKASHWSWTINTKNWVNKNHKKAGQQKKRNIHLLIKSVIKRYQNLIKALYKNLKAQKTKK